MKIVETDFGRVVVFTVIRDDGSTYEHMQTHRNNFYPFGVMDVGDVAMIDTDATFITMRKAVWGRKDDGRKFKCTKSDPRHNGMHTCERIE